MEIFKLEQVTKSFYLFGEQPGNCIDFSLTKWPSYQNAAMLAAVHFLSLDEPSQHKFFELHQA